MQNTSFFESVAKWLRFNRVMPASHDGGGRDQTTIEAALAVSPDVRPCNVVLIDDGKTSGAHLRACANVLRRAGATVEVAIVAGATTQVQVDNPLDILPVDLEAQPFLFLCAGAPFYIPLPNRFRLPLFDPIA